MTQLPEPATVRAALQAAGFIHIGGRAGLYTRWRWPADRRGYTMIVPENPANADFADLMQSTLAALSHTADQGARAQQALDVIAASTLRLPSNPADLAALVKQPTLAHLTLDAAFPGAAALLSPCRGYRYALTRMWGSGPIAVFMMLNPSTADALDDDATIRRCVGFARREGCGGLVVINTFALRSTDPANLATNPDAVGPNNAQVVQTVLAVAKAGGHPVIAAWGADSYLVRSGHIHTVAAWIAEVGVDLKCLGVTQAGHPKHPVRLHSDTPLVAYTFPKGV